MPQTKVQDVVFTVMMVLAMVYVMVCYNIALDRGALTNAVFALALRELPVMAAIAFVLEFFLVGSAARRLAFRMVRLERDPMILVILAISAVTVFLMCPIMSFFAVVLFQSSGAQLPAMWVQTAALNFPVALCWQIFFAGPAVRALFRLLFQKQLRAPAGDGAEHEAAGAL